MRVWDGIGEVPDLAGSVVTIGMFSGMHRGHQAVISETIAQSRELGLPSVAITFTPHPLRVHRPDLPLVPLTTRAQRVAALATAGVDAVLLIEYSLEFAQNSPEDFVSQYLVDALRVRAVVLGEDSRFGAGNSGDAAEMARLGVAMGGDPLTFAGLAGMGDLIATCSSRQSRNNSVGLALGRGVPIAEILASMNMVAEGVKSSPSVLELARRYGVEMPITEQVVAVCHEGRAADQALTSLMSRSSKSEFG